jgi:two-component system cell cycle response regulator
MNILVADDDPTSRLIVATALRNLGHECQTVTDGARAWDAFRSHRPDVVISDWMMPGLSGLQLCSKIREHDSGRYVYFIMVSGQGLLDEILQGMTVGADDYLVKPLDPDDLQARLIAAARVTSLHRQLAQQRTELEALNHDLASIARRDPLTGLGNRRALQEDLELLEARVTRYGHRYCMGLLDVDHFKSYNDAYGHQAGDDVLQAVAAQLKAKARSGDALYRYGGEEFLCIFPEQSMASGTHAIERMRIGVERLAVSHADSPRGLLTVSAGVAMLDPDHIRSASEVLKEADIALYRAKQLGRNRVERAEQTTTAALTDAVPAGLIAPAALP